MKPEELKAIEELLEKTETFWGYRNVKSTNGLVYRAAPAIRALLQENKRYEEALKEIESWKMDKGDWTSCDCSLAARTALGEK